MKRGLRLGIHFGALAPPLLKQVAEQYPVTFTDHELKTIRYLQRDADALVRLAVRGVVTSREKTAAQKRLLRRLCAVVGPALKTLSLEG